MAGRIPQQFIDELMSRVDIVDLIDARVPLRKTGRDYTARCPFHDDRTPSFVIDPAKNLWHCFGACSTGGSVIAFLQRDRGISFRHQER